MMRPFLFLALFLLLDVYVFFASKHVINLRWSALGKPYMIVYIALSIITLLIIPNLRGTESPAIQNVKMTYFRAIIMGLIIAKIITAGIFCIDDIKRALHFGIHKITASADAELINRRGFISYLGMIVGGGLFTTLLWGFKNKYNYQVRTENLSFDNLPEGFENFKIVQLSDIHSGSFMNPKAVQKGVDMANALKPDLILFTGDLVNNKAVEMLPFIGIFSQLKAKHGVYSTLGNHDYGDYTQWKSAEDKANNLNDLKAVHAQMGWKLLNDENVKINQNNSEISLIGVQNISGRNTFKSYGNLNKARQGADAKFKILMSHDPSHWHADVLTNHSDIDLTLSGHTHGMQFGIEIPGVKFSPVQWVYKQWAGLYNVGSQRLYVNRGFGFIGYPGRVGIMPEITLINLKKG